jgi:hypothetical protein
VACRDCLPKRLHPEGCWHKLNRAKHHFDELDNRVGAWANFDLKPPFRFEKKFYAKLNRFTFHVEGVEEVPVLWSLIAGDALTNFRAALDYLAQDLVGRGSERKWKGTSKPKFPVCMHPNEFVNDVENYLPGIAAKHRAIVKRYQPYEWGASKGAHPFAVLTRLVNRDKHRELQLAAFQHVPTIVDGKFRAKVIDVRDFSIRSVEPGRAFGKPPTPVARLKPGAEVARFSEKRPDLIPMWKWASRPPLR